MSGHSKWATIKRKKGDLDAKKGKIFTKLVREVTTAARLGGADINGNPRLRAAVQAAKAARMPADNIERAIKKGTGALEGPAVEEIVYEGYGPGGVAIYVEAQTDNRNRTVSEVRATFAKLGGNMGATGSVAYMFQACGRINVLGQEEDAVMEVALGAGATDVVRTESAVLVSCEARDFARLLDALEASPLRVESAELTRIADNVVDVEGLDAERIVKLVDRLEDLDDVQKVYANANISDDEMARITNLD